MSWQSYIVQYTDKVTVKKIMDAMDEYQHLCYSYTGSSEPEVEEELTLIVSSTMKQPDEKGKYAVMFGISGGRHLCYNFFIKRGIRIEFYKRWMDETVDKKSDFTPFDEKFLKFPENFIEQLVDKKLVD